MGEVYRAKDTRLDRSVAIKVLPAHLSPDPDLKHRLERESKAVSALCQCFGVGFPYDASHDGQRLLFNLAEEETQAPLKFVTNWPDELSSDPEEGFPPSPL